jgi:dolichyl-diphosphooligosaccharide--protein glycosyltransferase
MASDNKASSAKASTILYSYATLGVASCCALYIAYWAFHIRLVAIEEYGRVIHEFDPYFNYRAAEVRFVENGTDDDADKPFLETFHRER